MVIRLCGKIDILEKEKNETIIDFSEAVKKYHRSSSCTADEFCKAVSVEGLTLEEAAILYGDVQRTEGSNVILFQGKRRFPMWQQEKGGLVS